MMNEKDVAHRVALSAAREALEFYANGIGSAGLEFPKEGANDKNTVEFGTRARLTLELIDNILKKLKY